MQRPKGSGGGSEAQRKRAEKGKKLVARFMTKFKHGKDDKSGKGGTKTMDLAHYKCGRALIVGDGDLTFSAALVKVRPSSSPYIATTYDPKEVMLNKYHSAGSALSSLLAAHVPTFHSVDGTKLSEHFPHKLIKKAYLKTNSENNASGSNAELEQKVGSKNAAPSPSTGTGNTNSKKSRSIPWPFDRIMFNFPHSGEQRVHINRALLRDFFLSCRPHLSLPFLDSDGKIIPKSGGKVLVVLKHGPPYDGWEIEAQAAHALFDLETKLPFIPSSFPGYSHQTTNPEHNSIEGSHAHVYVFTLSPIGWVTALKEGRDLVRGVNAQYEGLDLPLPEPKPYPTNDGQDIGQQKEGKKKDAEGKAKEKGKEGNQETKRDKGEKRDGAKEKGKEQDKEGSENVNISHQGKKAKSEESRQRQEGEKDNRGKVDVVVGQKRKREETETDAKDEDAGQNKKQGGGQHKKAKLEEAVSSDGVKNPNSKNNNSTNNSTHQAETKGNSSNSSRFTTVTPSNISNIITSNSSSNHENKSKSIDEALSKAAADAIAAALFGDSNDTIESSSSSPSSSDGNKKNKKDKNKHDKKDKHSNDKQDKGKKEKEEKKGKHTKQQTMNDD